MELNKLCFYEFGRPDFGMVLITKKWCVSTNRQMMAKLPSEDRFSREFLDSLPEEGVAVMAEDWPTVIAGHEHFLFYNDVIKIGSLELGKMPGSKQHNLKNHLIQAYNPNDIGGFIEWYKVGKDLPGNSMPIPCIALNPILLHEVCLILKIDKPLIQFHGKKAMVIRDATKKTKAIGYLMPTSLDDL